MERQNSMASLELYNVTTEEEFKIAGRVMSNAYDNPFNSFWEMLKGHTEDELLSRFWQWHVHTPGSQYIAVRKKDGDQATIGIAQWILHESNPFATGNAIPPVGWWPNEYMKDITEQAFETFFGRRPAYMGRPHVLLNICCVAQGARRQGAGRLLLNWGRNVADEKNLDAFVEATLDGVRLYESAGFTQIEPFLLDAKLSKKFAGTGEEKAWLKMRDEILPTPYPVVFMWRPKGADWKQGDVLDHVA